MLAMPPSRLPPGESSNDEGEAADDERGYDFVGKDRHAWCMIEGRTEAIVLILCWLEELKGVR